MSGKTSNESKAKYNAKSYDRLELVVKKGQKDIIKQHAEKFGYSLNGYINKLIVDDMKVNPKICPVCGCGYILSIHKPPLCKCTNPKEYDSLSKAFDMAFSEDENSPK
jgi:hypothetical protein